MTRRYIFALGLLGVMSLASFFILQENIKSEKTSASIINVSGRQRMLSQRIAAFSLRLTNAQTASERRDLRDELKVVSEVMERSHNGLINGDASMGLPGKPSLRIKELYFSPPSYLDKQVHRYLEETRALISDLDNELSLRNPHLSHILTAAQSELLQSLDIVVKQYQKESEAKIARLQTLQTSVLIVTLFVLAATGLFIFRPMLKRIREETEQLRKINEFNKTLLKTIPFGIDIVDETGNTLYLDGKLRCIFGEESLGKKCYHLYKDNGLQCEDCPLKNGVEIGQTKAIETKGMMDGKTILITHTGMLYQGKKAILELFRDITDYKIAQEQLAISERLAVMGRMASVIAHEFRNQLGVMRNAVYFIKTKAEPKDEKAKRHLEILDEEIMAMERIIENILTFSRIKKPELQAIDLRELLNASIEKVRVPNEVAINIETEKLPAIQADPVQLGGVFVNIILNAIEAMEGKGNLTISGAVKDNRIYIVFKDAGKGITEEDRKRLFEPFFSTKPKGTGLGLATARIIVNEHRGSIDIESEYGKGTSVIIRLPVGG